MKKILCIALILFLISVSAFAHPGGIDERGGHYVRSSGWDYEVGSYHYHDGEFVTEVVNGVPQVDMTLRVIPSKLYPDDIAEIKIDMSDRFRDQLVLSIDNDSVAELADYELKAVKHGIVTVSAYVNEDSYTSHSVEVFPFPKETISLECSKKFIFVGKPFTVEYNVDYNIQEGAPSWDREPTLDWYSYNADIHQNDDCTAEVTCKTRGEVLTRVSGKLGGYATYKFRVYGIEDIFLWSAIIILLVVLLVTSSLLMAHKHKTSK